MERQDLTSLGIGLGVGLLAGAILALLYTPQSGKETRTLIKTKVKRVRDKVSGKFKKGG